MDFKWNTHALLTAIRVEQWLSVRFMIKRSWVRILLRTSFFTLLSSFFVNLWIGVGLKMSLVVQHCWLLEVLPDMWLLMQAIYSLKLGLLGRLMLLEWVQISVPNTLPRMRPDFYITGTLANKYFHHGNNIGSRQAQFFQTLANACHNISQSKE